MIEVLSHLPMTGTESASRMGTILGDSKDTDGDLLPSLCICLSASSHQPCEPWNGHATQSTRPDRNKCICPVYEDFDLMNTRLVCRVQGRLRGGMAGQCASNAELA